MRNNLIYLSIKYIFDELKENKQNIMGLAVQNMRQQTLRTSLGIGWVFFRDVIFYFVFTIFRYLMSGSEDVEGMNFILYLLVGMIAWNFMSECINGGITAIKHNKNILSSMKFPISILPTIEIIAIFLKRLFTLLILFVVIMIFGSIGDITWWMLIYYFISMFVFMIVWNLIFSAIMAVSNDFEQLYRSITSVLFFTMPIMWSFEILKSTPWIIRFFKLNPFIYIIEGFRDACVLGNLPDLEYTLYFWGLCLILFCVGSILQYKLRRHYVDLI